MIRCFVGYYGNEPCYEWRETDEEIEARHEREREEHEKMVDELLTYVGKTYTSYRGTWKVLGMEDGNRESEWVDVEFLEESEEFANETDGILHHYPSGTVFTAHLEEVLKDMRKEIDK